MKRVDSFELTAMAFATFIGLAVRLVPVLYSVFPLNDGGLFYTMIGDLEANHFRLPAFTTYNGASIPFAYPPLAFYLYAALHSAAHVPLLRLMQYGPAVISCASIPAFYLLARDMLDSKAQAAMAMAVFTLIPRAFDWLIMGGGVTRSLGMLFALLAMRQAFLMFPTRSRGAIVPMIIAGSLVVYTHPEAATHTVIAAALFYLFKDRSRAGLLNGVLAATGILLLASPWWGTVIMRHGVDPFLAASAAAREDSYNPLVGLLALFQFDFADEPFVTILTVLGLLGIFLQLAQRRLLLPLLLLAMHTLEPRGGVLFMMIPLSMCAGVAVDKVLLPQLSHAGPTPIPPPEPEPGSRANWLDDRLRGHASRLFLGFVVVYGIMAAFATGWRIHQVFTLTQPDLDAFAWVAANTSAQSRFALVTQALPLRDASAEWFPALTDRESIATIFGSEWMSNTDFSSRLERYQSLQTCASQGAACLQEWSQQHHVDFEYVYVRTPVGVDSIPLGVSLGTSADYQSVYSSKMVAIFQRR